MARLPLVLVLSGVLLGPAGATAVATSLFHRGVNNYPPPPVEGRIYRCAWRKPRLSELVQFRGIS